MPITVEGPDGFKIEFPDDTSTDVIKDVMQRHFGAPTTPKTDAKAQEEPETWGEYGYGLLQKMGQGAALGFGDEIAAGAGAVGNKAMRALGVDVPEKSYSDILEEVRAPERKFQERHPWQSLGAEAAGGFAPMVAAPVGAALSAPTWAGRALNSARTGAAVGAAAGAGNSEGGASNRLVGALAGGATGAVAAPLISDVALPLASRAVGVVRDAARYGNNAVRSYRNPEQVAIENVADRMVASGLDPAAARAAVSPPPSQALTSRGFSPADLADIVSRQLAGESAASVAQRHGIGEQTARRYLALYRNENPTPLNIIDIAKEVQGEGASGPLWRLGRAAHGLSGDESADAAQALMSRQETQAGRVSGIARQASGGRDYGATLQAGRRRLQQEANTAYRDFYQQPDLATDQLSDLMADPLFREANLMAQRRARVETIRRNQEAVRAGRQPEPVPDVDADNQMFTPEMLDQIQRQLRIASEGAVSNPNAARHAQALREVFLDRIEQHYPTFRGIRQQYAQGMGEFGEDGALQAGRDMTNRLGERTDEALREFDAMTPAQQDLARLGFARKIQDDAANTQAGGAVANRFNNQATQDIIRRMWSGDRRVADQGERLIRNLRREAITTKTKNDVLSGARTAEYEGDMSRLMEGAKAAADVATLNFRGILQNLSTRLTTQMGQRGATETMRILTETDPARLLPLLKRLDQAAQTSAARRANVAALQDLRLRGTAAMAPPVGQISGDQQARKP